MKKFWATLIILMALGFATFGTASAINQFFKLVTGQGAVTAIDEVRINQIVVLGSDRMVVRVTPTGSAQNDITYTITLFFDGVSQGTDTVSWTQAQIDASVPKTVIFDDLELAVVTDYTVEVTR